MSPLVSMPKLSDDAVFMKFLNTQIDTTLKIHHPLISFKNF